MSERPPVTFVAWTSRDGRAREIAAALGGRHYAVFPPQLNRRLTAPLRYVASAVLTLRHLTKVQPAAVIVTNPPVFAGLIVKAWCWAKGVPYALDSHPTSFGAKDHRQSQLLLPLSRRLARGAVTTMVTTEDWVEVVESWGGRADVVHEAPAISPVRTPRPLGDRPRVLFVGIFSPDEPIREVLQAASRLPSCDFVITGDVARCDAATIDAAPANVRFSGYLRRGAYEDELSNADIVLALTTEPTSVMRAAYEAVYAEQPLVLSDTPALRPLFPHGVLVPNDADGITDGIKRAIESHGELRAAARAAREDQLQRWKSQLSTLRERLGS